MCFQLSLQRSSGSMEFMLEICTDTLPQTRLSYLAFRISCQETLERIVLMRQMRSNPLDFELQNLSR